jgi:hypothetical protein|tara:strand:- start:414 stop:698 length:285 start_codon:yes stop_codon:yes gene_type:complete
MPNNDDDLRNRLAVLEQQLSLRGTNDITRNNNNTDVQGDMFTSSSSINWKALYKVLESEVEELAFDTNAPQFIKTWASNLIAKLRTKVSPRDLL